MPVIDCGTMGVEHENPVPAAFEADGFAVCRAVVSSSDLDRLVPALPAVPRGGLRNILSICPQARELSDSESIRAVPEQVLGARAFVARAILFDKTPGANWSVPFHQDGTIAVRSRAETTGFGPWSIKDGVIHVQPPAAVLERMVTIRIHIDPCGAANGPLVILPGSHAHGFLDDPTIAHWKSVTRPVVCEADRGDAVLMRPLVLHASPKATQPAHRRVLHLEFASDPLPGGLEWAAA